MNGQEMLNSLFEKARISAPLLDKDEVHQLLSSTDHLQPKKRFAIKNVIIGVTSSIVIFGAVYFLTGREESPNQVNSQPVLAREELVDTIQTIPEQAVQIITKEKAGKQVITIINADYLTVETLPSSAATITEELPHFLAGPSTSYPKNTWRESTDNYIQLTNEELVNLGIYTDGNRLNYLNKMDTIRLSDPDENELIHHVYAFDMEVDQYGGTRTSNVHRDDSVLQRKSNPAIPLIVSVKNETETPVHYHVNDWRFSQEYKDKYVAEMRQHLVPVVIYTKGKPMIYKHDNELVFWFKNTSAFRDALPDDLRQLVQETYSEFDEKKYGRYIQSLIDLKKAEEEKYTLPKERREEISKRMIVLSKNDLKKLHIKFNGKKLFYKQTYKARNGENIKRELTIAPGIYYNSSTGKMPSVMTWGVNVYPWYETDSSMTFITNFVDVVDENKDGEKYFETIRARKKDFAARLDSMVPVYFSFDKTAINKSKEKNSVGSCVFWFPKSPAFLNAIPKEIADKILSDNQSSVEVNKPINIQSLKVLELNPAQLSMMGISTNGVIRVPHQLGNDSLYTMIGYSSTGTFLDFSTEYLYKDCKNGEKKNDVRSTEIKDQGNSIPLLVGKNKFGNNVLPGELEKKNFVEPLLVTDDLGTYWRSYQYTDKLSREDYEEMNRLKLGRDNYDKMVNQLEETEVDLLSRINTLIPILVRVNKEDTSFNAIGDHQWRPDVILWYEPSEALFSLLPQQIADEIRKEYSAIQRHESTSSCKHFESCQIITGKINTYTIYPNPCEEELNLTMNIQEDRSFTISLHDISGNEVKNYGEQVFQEKGEKEYHFSLNGLKSGMYMLLITSNQGEYIVQRIIKK